MSELSVAIVPCAYTVPIYLFIIMNEGIKRAEEQYSALNDLEERVWRDIADARYAYSIIDTFLDPLQQKSSSHFRNKYVAIINALFRASLNSVISALGRLLQRGADKNECTLLKYKNAVMEWLTVNGPIRSESSYSKESVIKLKNRAFVKLFIKKQKEFESKIMPIRNKLVAHSDKDMDWNDFPKIKSILSPCIDFVEEVHRICLSALEDSGISGQYVSESFKSNAKEWINYLLQQDKK